MTELIPAIDLRGGRCVRLLHGDYDQETVYDEDPTAPARAFAEAGASRVHVVDLDGARDGSAANREAIAAIAEAIDVPLQVGGGIRRAADAESLLAVVDRVVVGTAAIEDPDLLRDLATRFPGRVALGVDTRDGKVATRGWTVTTETTGADLVARFADLALAAVIYTDIARDGALAGPNLEALAAMVDACPFPVIASGGVSSLGDVEAVARTGAAAMIVGRAIYTGDVPLAEALARLR